MKKKYLLVLLPAALVLTSCGIKPAAKNEAFLEDTLAHEEIFGKVSECFAPKRAYNPNAGTLRFDGDLNPGLDPDITNEPPTIGVQSVYDSANNKVSFRFVAAVHFNDADAREASNAVWTRCVSKTDCSSYPLDDATPAPACNTAYLALSNGGTPYSIGDYNDDHNGTGYTHFVVYTLRNIDLSKYSGSSYYVSAYLSMSGAVGNVSSKAVAIRFDRQKQYAYDHNLGTGFIEGTFGGNPAIIEKTAVNNDSNAASFLEQSISKGDTFVVKAFDGTKLKIRNTSNFTGENNHSGYYFADDSGNMKANFKGTYNIYLNSSHEIYISANDVKRPLYAKPTNVGGLDSWWGKDGRWTALYAYNEDVTPKREAWFVLTADGDYLKTTEEVDSSLYNKAIFVEMKSGTSTPSWDNKNDTNETGNKAISLTFEDCAYLKDNGSGGKYFDWGSR